jgi:hypothetical protein
MAKKQFISSLILFIITFFVYGGLVHAQSDTCDVQLIGDVDGNGIIDVADPIYLYQFLHMGGPSPGPNADINGDCIINIDDYNCLMGYNPPLCTPVSCTCTDPAVEFEFDTCDAQFPGDVDNNGQITIWDAAYLTQYLNQTGPPPEIMANADPNGDCVIDSLDIIRIIGYMFKCAKESKCGYIPVECTCEQPVLGEYFQDPCFGVLPGDANNDGARNIGDGIYVIEYVFKQGPPPRPYYILSGDVNRDCNVNVGDAVYIIQNVFKGGPGPANCAEWNTFCGDIAISTVLQWYMQR